MPAYNAERYIKASIESIINQSFKKWELIVVDDCSTDSTLSIVDRLSKEDSRIRSVRLNRNMGGPAGPRNIGVSQASFDLVAFCDSDDLWHPEKLTQQISVVNDPQYFFCCTRIEDFRDESRIVFHKYTDFSLTDVNYFKQCVRSRVPTSSVVVSKEIIKEFCFNESPEYKAVEDYDAWIRILKSGINCVKIDNPLVFYRICEGQISASKIKMMKKVFMVHKSLNKGSYIKAFFLTLSHVIGGFYFRYVKGNM